MKREWARYRRVSRKGDRAGDSFVSPEIQAKGINSLIRSSGGKSGPEFEDIDRTGRDFNRDGVRAAIAWVMEDPTRRGLATYDVSRWARTTSEGLAEIKKLRAAGAVYGSYREKIDNTPEGNLALTIWLAMAEHQSEKIGATWRAVHEGRAERGKPHGRPPVGYVLVDGEAVHDPETADGVREVFERYARGESIKSVAARLSEIRGRYEPTQNTKRLLANRFYVGDVKYRGEWYPGAHERLVSEQLWARVSLRLDAERGQAPVRAEPRSWLLGLARCDSCGGGVQAVNTARGRGGIACTRVRKQYRDARACDGFGAPSIEQVEELTVVTLLEHGQAALRQAGRANPGVARVRGLEADVATLKAGQGRLVAALARDGLTDSEFDTAMKQIRVDLEDAEARLADARRDLVIAPDRSRLLDVLALLRPDVLPPSEARTVLRELVKELRIKRMSEGARFQRWEGEITPVWR